MRIQIDGEDFYIDLLFYNFYNRKLKRLVVVEVKQGSFKPMPVSTGSNSQSSERRTLKQFQLFFWIEST
jgi:hypothetical protein